jgi:Zn-dependent M28 family amino/carboxypeptidase
VQEFEFAFFQQTGPSVFEQVSPTATTYAEGPDFALMDYSASGEVEGTLVPIDVTIPPTPAPSSTSGCETADFPAPPAGTAVALIQRGTCTFEDKVTNAVAAGYDGVVLFNEGQPGRTDAFAGTLGNPAAVPAIMASFAIGAALYGLAQSAPVSVRIETETISETRTSANVIAETRGRARSTIVVGAHLDSVLEGPGINDNASGSGAILEVAEELGEARANPKNRIRFIWFGAEENNLLGSDYYVSQLPPEELGRIALMLNFDMIGSSNYVRFVYDGDGSAGLSDPGPPGSDAIEEVFLDHFGSLGLATEPTAFDGRSSRPGSRPAASSPAPRASRRPRRSRSSAASRASSTTRATTRRATRSTTSRSRFSTRTRTPPPTRSSCSRRGTCRSGTARTTQA